MSIRTAPVNGPIPLDPVAVSTMRQFPVIKSRSDMLSQEYYKYSNTWNYFQTVWVYNYSVSTLNAAAEVPYYGPYEFNTNENRIAYIQGQAYHGAQYPSSITTFASIQF